jgi:hypothetical protein
MLDNDPQLAYIVLAAFWLTFFAIIGLRVLMTHLSYRRVVRRRFKALRDYEPHPQFWGPVAMPRKPWPPRR